MATRYKKLMDQQWHANGMANRMHVSQYKSCFGKCSAALTCCRCCDAHLKKENKQTYFCSKFLHTER